MNTSFNKIIILGYVGSAPEFHSLKKTGEEFVTFSVATSERWKDKRSDSIQTRTDWHKIITFQQALIKIVKRNIKSGSRVYIEGRIRNREYISNDGKKRHTNEIIIPPYQGILISIDNNNENLNNYTNKSNIDDDNDNDKKSIKDNNVPF